LTFHEISCLISQNIAKCSKQWNNFMKIQQIEKLINNGSFAHTDTWRRIEKYILKEIGAMDHPIGRGKFLLYPESGKKRGEGNGVTPIKISLMNRLAQHGWKLEEPLPIATRRLPGKFDAVYYSSEGTIVLEWETGNISSSHRALNKMSLGLLKGKIAAGILIVPSREMYKYLTDRVGNYAELEPYLDLWRAVRCDNGVLEIVVIEHDDVSYDVPRIPKGTDGRALA